PPLRARGGLRPPRHRYPRGAPAEQGRPALRQGHLPGPPMEVRPRDRGAGGPGRLPAHLRGARRRGRDHRGQPRPRGQDRGLRGGGERMSEETMDLPDGVVIIGGGQSAAVAARTLRRKKYTGAITVLGEEPHRPYQRPPLSKEYLEDPGASIELLPPEWTEAQDVTVRTDAVVERIEEGPVVVTTAGERVPASAVLLATGGVPRTIGDATGERIHHLRTRDDADHLRAALDSSRRLVVVGAGFIGAEIASAARAKGVDVTVLEAAEQPMQRALGPHLGEVCATLQRGRGVDLRLSTGVTAVRETADGVAVDTTSGEVLADHAVVAVGITPRTAVAEASGIACENGVLVDAAGRPRMTGVWAAEDGRSQEH